MYFCVVVVISFSPLVYPVMEGGTAVVRLQADKEAGFDYTIDVMQVDGGQFQMPMHTRFIQHYFVQKTSLLVLYRESPSQGCVRFYLACLACSLSGMLHAGQTWLNKPGPTIND